YIADLDAIRGGAVQHAALARIADAVAGCTLWLDAGFTRVADGDAVRTHRVAPVFGSESLAGVRELEALLGHANVLLSLDQKGGQPMDPAGCWQRADCWPSRVIVMTLDRVGANAGPDLETFASVQKRAGRREVIGAGGVRNGADLQKAR